MKKINTKNLINGAIEFHVHGSPDVIKRKKSEIEIVKDAKKHKLKGVILKNHNDSTVMRAFYIKKIISNINVFGGLALNESYGGINPKAVEIALNLGAKIIWFPTISAKNHKKYFKEAGGISILRNGELTKKTIEILKLIKKYNAIFSTGHLSFKEIKKIIEKAKELKINKIIVGHPEWQVPNLNIEQQKEISGKGVYFERCYFPTTDPNQKLPIRKIVKNINSIGYKSTILATDFGQSYNIAPIKAFQMYLKKLLEHGISEQKIEVMIKDNPNKLLF